jgi:hypothetical protein
MRGMPFGMNRNEQVKIGNLLVSGHDTHYSLSSQSDPWYINMVVLIIASDTTYEYTFEFQCFDFYITH